jgi:thiosulfate/3-mercaptopyruvate sulfurtransferase
MPDRDDALVSTAWLAEHLGDPDLRVVDGTYYLPNVPRDADAEFRARHIPGAVRFDIDAIKDEKNPLPHMLPGAEEFAAKVGALGIGDGTRVVAYNADGASAAARVWWMFRVFGHDRAAVLDGGLPKWLAEGRPVETGPAKPRPAVFTPRFHRELVRALAEVRAELASGRATIADARSSGRFTGAEPEIRPGLKSGHMPGAKNLPYADILAADGTYLPPNEIARRFATAGIDTARPVTTSCGSGVTACILALGLYLAGKKDAAVYDGSWTEWGGRDDTPVATG